MAGPSAGDADGRVIDLHAMRTTLGDNPARNGVVPQSARRIVRHDDDLTTMRRDSVPGVGRRDQAARGSAGDRDG